MSVLRLVSRCLFTPKSKSQFHQRGEVLDLPLRGSTGFPTSRTVGRWDRTSRGLCAFSNTNLEPIGPFGVNFSGLIPFGMLTENRWNSLSRILDAAAETPAYT